MATTQHNPDDWIPEEEVAKQLNVDRDVMRLQRRGLGEGEVKSDGKLVCWLRDAAERVATTLGLPVRFSKKNTPPDPAPPTATTLPAGVEELTVVSRPGAYGSHFGQRHLIKAKRLNGDIVTVRVCDSRKYMPLTRTGEMKLKARPAPTGNWWELYGREPRWPGVW